MEAPRIPIRNLYYLLCYSWNQLKQGELVDVSKVPTTELVDLFAFVLCDGIQHLARRGLEQGYETQDEEIAGVRGRMDVLGSARRFLPAHGRAACSFDELTANTLANQILKSTLRQLGRAQGLNAELRKRVQILRRDLRGIDEIAVTSQSFRRVQLHANNRFYRFLLNVCELIQGSWLADQKAGIYRFRDFVRDERAMARVFQNFLFNFIRTEIASWQIRREHIEWCATSALDPGLTLLPRMETDISLQRGTQHLIIDAKYYQDTLTQRYDAAKVHSDNLYQLMSYLTNAKRPEGETLQGMLIYPRVDRTLREQYKIQGYGVMVATVDLNRDWKDVKGEIIELIG
ncbi:MAG: 5-methylcytosine-specific restriction endonuclease system specificity protein McrC [Oxalobacteraceae bacterium]|nr:5-methylcytosine-specific restriction endonuclease system specificity protein McrC [Oxalobacteraceae bacterium]